MSTTTDATINLLAGTVRGWRGTQSASRTPPPAKLLELYSFESSPFPKRVRARLGELELPYVLRNTGKGAWTDMGPPSFRDQLFKGPKDTTRNRKWLADKTGKVQVPYLVDANND